MQINVKMLNGDTMLLDMMLKDTILDVKIAIQERENVDLHNIGLRFVDKELIHKHLKDEKTL